MEEDSLINLQDLDDLDNINLTSVGKTPDKPKYVPSLNFTKIFTEEDEIPCAPIVPQPGPLQAKQKSVKFPNVHLENSANKHSLNALKYLGKLKINSKATKKVDDSINKTELNVPTPIAKKAINVVKILNLAKQELKIPNTSCVKDLYEIKIKNRIKHSLAILRKGRAQKSLLAANIINAVICENLRFIEAHLDKCPKDSERLLTVNTQDQFYRTSLHYASALGFEECVYLLIAVGASPYAKDFRNRTPLHYASFSNNPKIITMLTRACQSHKTLVKKMSTYKNNFTVARLVKYKIEIPNTESEDLAYISGQKPPNILVNFLNFHEGIQEFLEVLNVYSGKTGDFLETSSKYIDLQDDEGRTALHLAVVHEKTSMVQALLEAKAKIDIEDVNGKRPLELSQSNFISTMLINKLKQALAYKKSKNSVISKSSLDNRDLKALSINDISMYMKNEFQESYLM